MARTGVLSLEQLMNRGQKERPKVTTPPDIICVTLKELATRYTAENPFKVGDLVTQRKGYNGANQGVPHIVVETIERDYTHCDLESKCGHESTGSTFGRRLNIRVATIVPSLDGDGNPSECVAMFWGESFEYEAYVPPEE